MASKLERCTWSIMALGLLPLLMCSCAKSTEPVGTSPDARSAEAGVQTEAGVDETAMAAPVAGERAGSDETVSDTAPAAALGGAGSADSRATDAGSDAEETGGATQTDDTVHGSGGADVPGAVGGSGDAQGDSEIPEDGGAHGTDDADSPSGGVDAPPTEMPSPGIGPDSACARDCAYCILHERRDLLPFYGEHWGVTPGNCERYQEMVDDWCEQLDAVTCGEIREGPCGAACGSDPPPTDPTPTDPTPTDPTPTDPTMDPPTDPAAGALPVGMSPFIYGMHDFPDPSFLGRAGQCARGWVTDLRYIGADGQCGAGDIDVTSWTDSGHGVIMRLDYGGAPALPPHSDQWDGFAASFADCVRRSRGIRVWVVGNEPNLPWGHPENRSFSPQEYADIYNRVLDAVDALPGGSEHEILFAGMAPWAAVPPWGAWEEGIATALAQIPRLDGMAIHAYTRVHDPAAVSSDDWFDPAHIDRWHLHFRTYRDVMRVLRDAGQLNIPLYITESGSVCDPPCQPYQDVDNGYFQAMYGEIAAWNQANPSQVVRAVTPYRWTLNDDGTGRNFCIGCLEGLQRDMQRAMDQGAVWTALECTATP